MKEKPRKLFRILCMTLLIGCAAYIAFYFGNRAANRKAYDDVKKTAKKVKTVKQPENEEPKEPQEEIPIDFASLQAQNPDVYAWIQIPDTNVDYPILQSATDDSYYLDHTIDGVEGYPGSIYTESLNSKDFTDFNTVIYGHDMKDGSMFKHLHKYEDMSFLMEHQDVIIYTPEQKYVYRIFAAVEYDDRHVMYSYDFNTDAGKQEFLDSIYNVTSMTKNIRSDINVGIEDRILTLATCIGGKPDKRLLVEAVLIDE